MRVMYTGNAGEFTVSLNADENGFFAHYAVRNGMMMDSAIGEILTAGMTQAEAAEDGGDECELAARHA